MSKKTLREDQKVTDLAANETEPDSLVADAAEWAMALWRRAEQLDGAGKDSAMHKAARWARVSPNTFWKLRYRRPKDIGASVYFRLRDAHQKHVQSVEAKLAENLIELKALPPSAHRDRLVADLEEFLGTAESTEAGAPPQRAGSERG